MYARRRYALLAFRRTILAITYGTILYITEDFPVKCLVGNFIVSGPRDGVNLSHVRVGKLSTERFLALSLSHDFPATFPTGKRGSFYPSLVFVYDRQYRLIRRALCVITACGHSHIKGCW